MYACIYIRTNVCKDITVKQSTDWSDACHDPSNNCCKRQLSSSVCNEDTRAFSEDSVPWRDLLLSLLGLRRETKTSRLWAITTANSLQLAAIDWFILCLHPWWGEILHLWDLLAILQFWDLLVTKRVPDDDNPAMMPQIMPHQSWVLKYKYGMKAREKSSNACQSELNGECSNVVQLQASTS